MTTENSLVFRVVATNPYWGEGSDAGWPGAALTKSAAGYTLDDVAIDDSNASAANSMQTPTSIATYHFPNNPSPGAAVFSSALLGQASITSTAPVAASAQALGFLEQSFAQQIQATNPNRIVVDFSGHGSQNSFFQGNLTPSDSVKLLTYIKTISNGATLVLDTSTNCDDGYVDFVQNYANAVNYVMVSEKQVGGYTPNLQAFLQYSHDNSLSTAWAAGNSTAQAFSTLLANEMQLWQASQSGLAAAGQGGEQTVSIFDMSQFQSFMAALGVLPAAAFKAMEAAGDVPSYVEASSNAALETALQKFLIDYIDTKSLVNWSDSAAGLGIESSNFYAQSDFQNLAASAAGIAVSGESVAAALQAFSQSHAYSPQMIVDSAAHVAAQLDTLESYFEAAETYVTVAPGVVATGFASTGIELTDRATPTLNVTAAQLVNDSYALSRLFSQYELHVSGVSAANAVGTASVGHVSEVAVADSAANVVANLDSLQNLAAAGSLTAISLTDSGIPTLSLSAAQLTSDLQALNAISGYFTVSAAAPVGGTASGVAGHGTTLLFNGVSAGQAVITPSGDGVDFTIVTPSGSEHLGNITALQFQGQSEIIASQKPAVAGGISSFQVTSLYAAVFDRLPDVAGLAYYQAMAAANPSLPITLYAQDFLSSPEYTGNSAHNYAETPQGDAQFITDTYTNLLHRGPGSGDVAWYQANVIAPFLNGLTAGTASYAAAELQAHAAILADFSQSAEFLGDVQITAQNPASAQHWLVLI